MLRKREVKIQETSDKRSDKTVSGT